VPQRNRAEEGRVRPSYDEQSNQLPLRAAIN